MRGHIDGDGTVRSYKDPVYPNSRRLYITLVSANKPHVIWLQRKIKRLYKIKGRIGAVCRAWSLTYAKKESKILLPLIYYHTKLPFLNRKRQIIADYL